VLKGDESEGQSRQIFSMVER
jgi:hypothetical protein